MDVGTGTPVRTDVELRLRPIADDFLPTLDHALSQRDAARAFVAEAITDGVRDVLFLGCGGSWASSVHAAHTLQRLGRALHVSNVRSSEVGEGFPARLGPGTLVIASAHSGGTPETVAAVRLAKRAGARIVTLAHPEGSALGELADLELTYRSNHTITSPKQTLLSHLTWSLLTETGAIADPGPVWAAYDALPVALRTALDEADDHLALTARALADNPFLYVLGAGPNAGASYLLSMCYLVEMQWRYSASFLAGEFFHGAFEMLHGDAGIIHLVGEDASRAVSERAVRFAEQVSPHSHVLDTTMLSLPGIAPELRSEVTPIALGVLCSRLAEHFEAVSGHSLDERRYMGRVDY
ncbi:SIS domain-containing protein [Micromonospora inyonensis]|nr:SIS domain-containing protein [Micromonospora inyonensis]